MRNFFDDGEPQAAAVAGRVGQTIKSLPHPMSVGFRNADSRVLDGEERLAAPLAATDGHPTARGGVFERVVDQIAQKIIDQRRIRRDRCGLGFNAQVDVR